MNTTLKPTGSDDTAMLRDAFAAVKPYSCVTLEGVFRVSGPVPIKKSDLTVLGYGACITQTAELQKTLLLKACANVKILGLSLMGCGKEKPWSNGSVTYNEVAGIYVTGSSAVTVDSCTLTSHAGSSVVLDGACENIRLHNNTIRGMGSPHIMENDNGCDAAIGGTSNSIAKSLLSIVGNDISGHAFGLLLPGDIDAIIQANHFHDIPGQHGMYLVRGGNLVIASNVIQRCAVVGMKIQQQTAEQLDAVITITANSVLDCGSLAIGVLTAGSGVGFSQENVSITDNNMFRCGYPLYLRGLRGAMVSGNRGRDCQHAMVKIDCDGVFSPNYFINCGA